MSSKVTGRAPRVSAGRLYALVSVLALLVLALPGILSGAPMTLDDCVARALDKNLSILEGEEVVSEAIGGIAEARSGFLPNLSLSGSYNFVEKVARFSIPDPTTGQSMDFDADFTRDYSFQLMLSQPLYAGGSLTGAYRIAKRSHEIAEIDLLSRQADAALAVIESFYGLLLARESVEVTRQSIEAAEEFLRVVRARYDGGEASSFEVMRAEVEVSNLQPALIGARNAVALSELALKNAMGVEAGSDIEFVGEFEAKAFEIDPADAVLTALEHRPEIGMMQTQKTIAEESIRLAKAGRYPTLSLTANYDVRADEITLESDKMEKSYAGYLVMSFPLFDGLRTRSRISQSYSQLRQTDIAVAGLEDGIELEVRSAALVIDAALETLKSQEKNVEMAGEGLAIANERYLQGYATNLEVMDAQLALTRGRNNRIQALHDLNLAVAKAKKAMGILLEDYKSGAR
ncbi:MAG: TolC family protein [Candidatus Eisenbacteria bacterium]